MKKHIYNAGPLFTKGEIKERLEEDVKLQGVKDYSFYNPITAPCNQKANLPIAKDIFFDDVEQVLKSDVILANLDHEDPGVMAELGIAWGLEHAYFVLLDLYNNGHISIDVLNNAVKRGVKNRKVAAVAYDLREGTAGEYDGLYVPFGRNQFVVGMLEDFEDSVIVQEFDDAINQL